MLRRLAVFMNTDTEIPIRGSGLKVTELKQAAKFEFVELLKKPTKKGTMPKNFSHFKITPLGKQVLFLTVQQGTDPRMYLQEIKMKLDALEEAKQVFITKLSEVHQLFKQLENMNIEDKRGGEKSRSMSFQDPDWLVKKLKEAEKQAPSNEKFKNFYSTDYYVHALMKTGLSKEEAKDALLRLYELEKLELQMGPEITRNAEGLTTRHGRTYHWGVLRD